MYLPEAFAETRLPVLHDAIDAGGLAIFVTIAHGAPTATHVPMLLSRDEGPLGTVHFHLARANPQWQASSGTALVIFPGPDGYVSPSAYPAKAEHGRVVPTWNYVTVHASGTPEFYHDAGRLHALVSRLTARHEARQPAPWAVTDAPAAYTAQMLRAIVGVALRIDTLHGKWKLGQNRSKADQVGLLAFYDAQGPAYEPMAEMTRERSKGQGSALDPLGP
jgi:transcriptional regulator